MLRECAAGGCLALADALIDDGASLPLVRSRVALVEALRLEFPALAGDFDELLVEWVRECPGAARTLACKVERKVKARRAGHRHTTDVLGGAA